MIVAGSCVQACRWSICAQRHARWSVATCIWPVLRLKRDEVVCRLLVSESEIVVSIEFNGSKDDKGRESLCPPEKVPTSDLGRIRASHAFTVRCYLRRAMTEMRTITAAITDPPRTSKNVLFPSAVVVVAGSSYPCLSNSIYRASSIPVRIHSRDKYAPTPSLFMMIAVLL